MSALPKIADFISRFEFSFFSFLAFSVPFSNHALRDFKEEISNNLLRFCILFRFRELHFLRDRWPFSSWFSRIWISCFSASPHQSDACIALSSAPCCALLRKFHKSLSHYPQQPYRIRRRQTEAEKLAFSDSQSLFQATRCLPSFYPLYRLKSVR